MTSLHDRLRHLPTPAWAALLALLLAATAGTLSWMGRSPACACGQAALLWSGDIRSMHNSQHVADPYTFTHVLHGIVFFGLLWPLRRWLPSPARLLAAAGLEAAWEVAENTEAVIQRYREATVSLGYYGDSITNSLADIGWCVLGFLIAARLPWWASALFLLATELFLLAWIRDSLTLNVIMLLYPVEAIGRWQAGG